MVDKSSEMLKISTKSMYRLPHAWHPSQLAINLSIEKLKRKIHVK